MTYKLTKGWPQDNLTGAFVDPETSIDYLEFIKAGGVPEPCPLPPEKSVLELDTEKYLRRADAKPRLMAEMAAMNIGRLKSGTWTTAQLVTLMADPEIKALVSYMETLSFELAISAINGLANPLITPEIKEVWVGKLTSKL